MTSLMNGHSAVCGPPPTHLFRLFGGNRANYGDLEDDAAWNALVEDMMLGLECKLGAWSTSITADELRQRAKRRCPAELLRIIYSKEAEHDGARILFVKENHTASFAPFLLGGFPDCRFVLLVRDPRDVASSWVSTDTIPGGVERATEVWLADQEASLSLYHQLRDTGRITLVRYEDLVGERTVETLRQLTAALGLSYEEGMLDFHRHLRTQRNARRIAAWANLARPVLKGNSGKYRDVLSEADLRYVELACFPLMNALGYPCDLTSELPGLEDLPTQLGQLRPLLAQGRYQVGEDEREIREHRLAAIKRVLGRSF